MASRQQFHVYVLVSQRTGRRYVGSTHDVQHRLARHNAGHSKATKPGRPWELVYAQQFPTRAEAVHRENYFKTGRGRDELDTLIR